MSVLCRGVMFLSHIILITFEMGWVLFPWDLCLTALYSLYTVKSSEQGSECTIWPPSYWTYASEGRFFFGWIKPYLEEVGKIICFHTFYLMISCVAHFICFLCSFLLISHFYFVRSWRHLIALDSRLCTTRF